MEPDVFYKVVAYVVIPLAFSVGGINLAVEVIPERKRRLKYQIGFPALALLGIWLAWVVEDRADVTHAKEISESKQEAQNLKATLKATRADTGTQIAWLQSHIPDEIAKAIAGVNPAAAKKEAPLQATTLQPNVSLKARTLDLVADLRDLGREYNRRIESIGKRNWTADSKTVTADSTATADSAATSYLTTDSGEVLTTDAGEPLVVEKEAGAQLKLAEKERGEFKAKYLDSVVALRDQLIFRLGGAPQLMGFPPYRLIAFSGYLTGPSSVTDAADYLEALANLLPAGTPGH
jgi:hypothetical protein